MPGRSAWSPFVLACVVLPQAAGVVPLPPPAAVRFHHVHYRVADPAAAMNDVAARTGGARVIAPGLGVGVRVGREYALFDRFDASDPESVDQPPLADAYAGAVRWLTARGVAAEPPTLGASPAAVRVPGARRDHVAFAADDLPAIDRLLTAGGGTVLRRTEDAVLFDAGNGLRIEIVRDGDREDAYWCPMHPDVRSPDEGRCPACGMHLVPIPPPTIGEYTLDVSQIRTSGGDVTGLDMAVGDPVSGALVTKFAVVHEKVFHLFVVSRDLRYFAHVHPEQGADGRFRLAHPLGAGEYMLMADFLPEGGRPQMVQKAIIAGGIPRPDAAADESGDLRVKLQTEDLAAGKHAQLSFTVEDAATGRPVTDLEPYLGAPAHMLMVRRDLSDAVHAHPEERETSGPAVSFHPIVPAAGTYRLWIQFQRAGRVSTHAFDLAVDR